MKTVKKMIEELKKFPPNAKCYAYAGETCGLGIVYKDKYGFIPCGEWDKNDDNCKTEYLKTDEYLEKVKKNVDI